MIAKRIPGHRGSEISDSYATIIPAQHKLKVIKRTVTEKTIVKWRKFETRGSVLIANDQRNAPGDTKSVGQPLFLPTQRTFYGRTRLR